MPSPRVLLSIDYEPWYALIRRYDSLTDANARRDLDGGYTYSALGPILEHLGDAKASFYLVGEIADWYPDLPGRIVSAGHELGLHCHIHRPLVNARELAEDIRSSSSWCRQYQVLGYRAPMVGISEAAYPLLAESGFSYSSSMYAPAGTLLQKDNIWELPVSTYKIFGKGRGYSAPREFSLPLLMGGEIPYGSSFSLGVLGRTALKIIEHELKAGRSPVIIFHPYELVSPSNWPARILRDILRNPLLWPFSWNKSRLLASILKHFPVSPLLTYLHEDARIPVGV